MQMAEKDGLHADDAVSQAPTSRRTSHGSLSSDETQLPSYEEAAGSAPEYAAAGDHVKFPVAFNLYFRKTSWKNTLWTIGEHKNQPLFSVKLNSGWRGTTLTLHRGPKGEDPILAEVAGKGVWGYHNTISVPAHNIFEEIHTKAGLTTVIYTFTAVVMHGEKAVAERFQWRQSHGQEVKQLSRYAWGWKLVRLDSSPANPTATSEVTGEGGKKPVREAGESSDGKEVLAVWADNLKVSKTKMLKFEFWGSAANGGLGEVFSVMAVATGIRIWQIMRTGTSGGAASASASAAALSSAAATSSAS